MTGSSCSDRHELDDFADRLQESCGLWALAATEPHDCPSSQRLWEAAAGELPPAKTVRLIDHLAQCPQCASGYRLALGMQSQLQPPRPQVTSPAGTPVWRQWMALAAALVLVALGLVIWQNALQPHPTPAMRGGTQPEIKFSAPQDAALPAQDFTLQWNLEEDVLSYDVDVYVASPDLRILDRARGLEEPSLTVAPSSLQGLPEGTVIYWKVEAIMADGQRATSTRSTRLQR
ncbi:MAG TPA: zf-HC2 domain-containing protein [Acidobacteriota bacterium]|nr:zf-HC2 domain-containing protein [Acidobacteriota bacterium]